MAPTENEEKLYRDVHVRNTLLQVAMTLLDASPEERATPEWIAQREQWRERTAALGGKKVM